MESFDLRLLIYIVVVLCVAGQRLGEIRHAQQHEASLLSRGGREVAPRHVVAMRLLHTLWLVSCAGEALWRRNLPDLIVVATASLLFIIGQMLRYAAMYALGERWTVRIVVLPNTPPVTHGIYRYMRHPNYLGVMFELAALPLIFGGWVTAVAFSVANACLLYVRIRVEEAALETVGGYKHAFARVPRFVPRKARAKALV
jgi:methyltransferase